MDENKFRTLFNKKSVFKEASTLDHSWVPPILYCRDDTIETLVAHFRRILEEKEQPSINCLILGKGGVGKTCTAKFFGRNFKSMALEKDVNLFVEYFDCINFRSKSKIIRELLAKYLHGSGRGYSDDEAIKQILTRLVREKEYILLIIDEVQQLKPDEILALLNISESFGHQNAKISIILIARENEWMRVENEKILSRLNSKIKLKPYNFEEALKILKYRSEIAFKEDVINDDLLEMVSEIVVENKNMRHGIEILRKSGLYADKEGLEYITPDMIRAASNEVYPTFRGELIDQLNDQELLTLYGITQALINNGNSYCIVDEAYEEYSAICENYNIDPHVKMSFRKYIRQLTQLKIVKSRSVKIDNSKRGRRLEITLLDIPAPKLMELLEDLLERKYGE
ncbi:MAG: Cdc6/Cdc18 family protein [Promethearchaeota archaeon]